MSQLFYRRSEMAFKAPLAVLFDQVVDEGEINKAKDCSIVQIDLMN